MSFSRPNQWYHSHDPICPVGTFNISAIQRPSQLLLVYNFVNILSKKVSCSKSDNFCSILWLFRIFYRAYRGWGYPWGPPSPQQRPRPCPGPGLRSVLAAPENKDFWFSLYVYCILYCFICRPSDSTVSEYAGMEPRTVATSALAVRRSYH